MRTIVIPVDGSEFSKKAMEKGKEIASIVDCKIVLLSVSTFTFPNFPVESTEYAKSIYDDKNLIATKAKELTKNYLKEGKESFGDLSEKVETVLLEGNPASKILEYLEDNEVDLVIMGSRGVSSSGIHRLLVGSVTTKVLHMAKQPILVIK